MGSFWYGIENEIWIQSVISSGIWNPAEIAAVGVAIAAALMVSWALGRRESSEADESVLSADEGKGSVLARTLGHFDELLYHVGPFTVVGLIVAAYVQAALPAGAAVPRI